MATIVEMETLIDSLTSGGDDIPGLDLDTIADGMVEENEHYKATLDGCETPAEREHKKAHFVETIKAQSKAFINEKIATIKFSVTEVKEGVIGVTKQVTSIIASTVMPPAIGSPPVAPNPAYVALQNEEKKNGLMVTIKGLEKTFLLLLQAAVSIGFILPGSILGLLQTILTVKNLIQTIP